MNQHEMQTLFDYNDWANTRVLEAATRLTPEQFVAPAGLSHGSVRGALVHVLGAEMIWRLRCQEGIMLSALPSEAEFPTLDALRARWRDEEQKMRGYLAACTDDDFQKTIRYTSTTGVPFENVLWHLLTHVVNHGTQFRAEAAVGLTAFGQSPGDLDMLIFFRERARERS